MLLYNKSLQSDSTSHEKLILILNAVHNKKKRLGSLYLDCATAGISPAIWPHVGHTSDRGPSLWHEALRSDPQWSST